VSEHSKYLVENYVPLLAQRGRFSNKYINIF